MFNKTEVHESTAFPGVRYTVRRLNAIKRAERDMALIEHQVKLGELQVKLGVLYEPDEWVDKLREQAKAEKRELTAEEVARIEAHAAKPETVGRRVEIVRTSQEQKLIFARYVKPAYLKAGIVKIEHDGKDVPLSEVFDAGPEADALMDEMFSACSAASELSAEQSKNSSALSPSSTPEEEGATDTAVTTAAK